LLLDRINQLDQREVRSHIHNSRAMNGTIIILRWILTHLLDPERPAVNLGCYTCRDLDYLLPICRSVKKPIECVDSWSPVKPSIREQLCAEIESRYADPLVTFTWKDAHESEMLRSADYIYFSTDWRFPIEQYIAQCNHPSVWASNECTYLWPRLGQQFYNEQCHLLWRGDNNWVAFTNDLILQQQFFEAINLLNAQLKPNHQWLEINGPLAVCRYDHPINGMKHQWDLINSF
jgi:hypothetical protein